MRIFVRKLYTELVRKLYKTCTEIVCTISVQVFFVRELSVQFPYKCTEIVQTKFIALTSPASRLSLTPHLLKNLMRRCCDTSRERCGGVLTYTRFYNLLQCRTPYKWEYLSGNCTRNLYGNCTKLVRKLSVQFAYKCTEIVQTKREYRPPSWMWGGSDCSKGRHFSVPPSSYVIECPPRRIH